ncbi:hypothetical protein BX600DRAFT_471413 [Xylariales sp. PMI_506]|nr:hypothetical protein BX600DRAFT_471413 [Xylariales sp. PMI_506]
MFSRYALRQARLLPPLERAPHAANLCHVTRYRVLMASYATARRTIKVPKSSLSEERRFTAADIPPLAFWKDMARPQLVVDPGLSAQECLDAVHAYVALSNADQKGFKDKLAEQPHPVPYSTLHYVAVMLLGGSNGPAWGIALHILQTLVTLNYTPSILSMVRLGLRTKKLGTPTFRLAEDKHAVIARRGNNADACALQGLILSEQATPEGDRQALEWFRNAASIGGEEPGAWDWQGVCALAMGRAYFRLGDKDKARSIWAYCAKTLDLADGCWLYASLLDPADPQRQELVLKAALSGVPEAAEDLASSAAADVARTHESSPNSWERKVAQIMKEEWEAIIGKRVLG